MMSNEINESVSANEWYMMLREAIAEKAHNRWVELQQEKGVVYGPERTEATHPHMLPYDQLPGDQRKSDYIAAESAIDTLLEIGLLNGAPDFTQKYRNSATMYSAEERESQFDVEQFGKARYFVKDMDSQQVTRDISYLVHSFPEMLAGKDFNNIVDSIVKAYRKHKPVIAFIGGHVIKCGLAPMLSEMLDLEVITHVAMNGAAAIHDIEFAMYGHSSEWVRDLLPRGKWGMWAETGEMFHGAVAEAARNRIGLGAGLCRKAHRLHKAHAIGQPCYADYSLLAQHKSLEIPVTVHVAIGCDVVHQHPYANFGQIGETSGRDFYKLMESIRDLNDGGVFLNFGSEVMGPEVFSKALNLARNTGHTVENFVTANFDVMELPEWLSRAKKNVVIRPHIGSEGKGYNFVGSHEIMIPLLFHAVAGRL